MRKTILTALLAGLMLTAFFCVPALADEGVLTLPTDLTTIEAEAFQGLTDVARIDLPAGVTKIGAGAFRNCGNPSAELRYYFAPAGVTVVDGAFENCHAVIRLNGSELPRLSYTVGADGVTITGMSGQPAEVVIPDTIEGKPVTALGNNAFNGRSNMTRVVIPSTVTSIGNDAFRGCSALAEIQLPSGLTGLGLRAFRDCGALTEILIPAGITEIGAETFSGARMLVRAVLPEGLLAIRDNAFNDCYALSQINIPSTVTEIGYQAFRYNTALTEVVIPSGVTALSSSVFSRCENLRNVTLPAGLTEIGEYAFLNCKSLTSINLPEGLTTIGKEAFRDTCISQTGNNFYVLPDSLTSVGDYAFSGCGAGLCVTKGSDLETVVREKSWLLTYPGETDFRYRYTAAPANGETTYTLKLVGYTGAGGSVTIPSGPAAIAEGVFKGNTDITAVTVPGTVAQIERSAFEGCTNLTKATMSEGLTAIMNLAFGRCSKLEKVDFPATLTELYSDAFNGACTTAGVHFYTLPDNLTMCDRYVFANSRVTPAITRGSTTETVIQSTDYVYAYKDNLNFRYRMDYYNSIRQPGLYDYLGTQFPVRLPDDCKGVRYDGFKNLVSSGLVCAQLSDTAAALSNAGLNFTFPGHEDILYRVIDGVLYVMGFRGSGTEIIIPKATDYINEGWDEQIRQSAFLNLENITKLVIPEGVTKVNSDACSGCRALTDITLPQSLQTLGIKVFLNCGQNSTEPFYLTLPDNMTDLVGRGGGANSFEDLNAVLVCGKTSQTAALLTDRNYVYTVAGEEDFRYRYEPYTEGDETGRRLWLVGYTGMGSTANIPAGIYGIKFFSANRTATNWPTFYGYGFRDNTIITKAVIPENTVVIAESAFHGCLNLTDITFPDSLREIKDHAFEQCGKNAQTLHYYILPDQMTSIGTNVGAGWGAFTDINMGRLAAAPDTSTALQLSGIDTYDHGGSYRFALKGHLTDGLLYRYREYTLETGEKVNRLVLEQYEGSSDEVVIPADCGVWRIDAGVFQGKTGLTRISIPEGVVEIGNDAFNGCTLLHGGRIVSTDGAVDGTTISGDAIYLPVTLKRLGTSAFKDVGSAYMAERFFLVFPAGLESFDISIVSGCNAVMVAPGGPAATTLYSNLWYYYPSVEDALKQQNLICQPVKDENGNIIPNYPYKGRR